MKNRCFSLLALLAVMLSVGRLWADELPVEWDMDKLSVAPAWQPLPSMDDENVHAVLIEGPAYKGEATRFFAFYALPEGADAQHPVPAMVLVHGGGGTAFASWVKEWVARGYAAIALDTTGRIPLPLPGDPFAMNYNNWALLPGGIHLDWGGYERAMRAVDEQWPYCALCEVIIAHTFLRNIEGVDNDRIGITGNSWGGFLTLLAAAVDTRYKMAAPLYASGFYEDFPQLAAKSSEELKRWCELWDPSHYVTSIHIPMLWYGGATDVAFDYGCVQKTLAICSSPFLCVSSRPDVIHIDGGYEPGRPAEVYDFAEQFLKHPEGTFPQVEMERKRHNRAVAYVHANGFKMESAELFYTTDSENPWSKKEWRGQAVKYKPGQEKVTFDIPKEARYCFLGVYTDEGRIMSSRLVECERNEP